MEAVTFPQAPAHVLSHNVKKTTSSGILSRELKKCFKCHQMFSSKEIHKHYQNVHAEYKYLCGECGKEFSNGKLLNQHKRIHQKMKCSFCDREFAKKCRVQEHIEFVHGAKTKNEIKKDLEAEVAWTDEEVEQGDVSEEDTKISGRMSAAKSNYETEGVLHSVLKKNITSFEHLVRENLNQNKQIDINPLQQPILQINLPLSPPPNNDEDEFLHSFIEKVKCTNERKIISRNPKCNSARETGGNMMYKCNQ